MKKLHQNKNLLLGISACLILSITAMAFKDSTKIKSRESKVLLDTVPKKNTIEININTGDLEKTIRESLALAEKSIKEIDWDKISNQINHSVKSIDLDKIKIDIDNAVKSIDVDKIRNEIDRSVKEIDKVKLKTDVERGVRDAVKSINKEELKRNLDEIKKSNIELKKETEKLKKELEKSKEEMKNTTDVLSEMEANKSYKPDGLFYKI